MLEMWKYPYVMGISTQFPYNTKVNQWIKDSALNIKVWQVCFLWLKF